MFQVQQLYDRVIQEWLPELAAHTGRSEEQLKTKGLSVYDFKLGVLRVVLIDSSFVEFQCAFHVVSGRMKAIAVFTEHCGHHAFPFHGAKVFRDGELLYEHV